MLRRRRAPQGARGLKCIAEDGVIDDAESRPARGAWVEIRKIKRKDVTRIGRAPQGARGLKSQDLTELHQRLIVAPRKGRVG